MNRVILTPNPYRDKNFKTVREAMAILKDADALDRCRIGDLKPDFLRYRESRTLINTIAGFCYKTRWQNRDIKFKEFINRCF